VVGAFVSTAPASVLLVGVAGSAGAPLALCDMCEGMLYTGVTLAFGATYQGREVKSACRFDWPPYDDHNAPCLLPSPGGLALLGAVCVSVESTCHTGRG